MTTYNTGNPIGSAAAQDLYDNAQNFDHLSADRVNEMWPDRFGVSRLTWHGMEERTKQAIINIGWNPVGSFQDGTTVTAAGDIVQDESTGVWYRWDDLITLPKTIPSGSTPDSTGGTGQGKWLAVDVSDVLRKDLASAADNKGDSLITVKQPFTGAAVRTQHDKNKDVINVKDFGSEADGVSDDTMPIQAAIDAAAIYGGKITFPQGVIRINGTVRIKSNVDIDLSGCTILATGNASGFYAENESNFSLRNGRIYKTINYPDNPPTDVVSNNFGVGINGCSRFNLDKLDVRGFGDCGIVITSSGAGVDGEVVSYSNISFCNVSYNYTGIKIIGSFASEYIHLVGCNAFKNHAAGIHNEAGNVTLSACTAASNMVVGYYLKSGANTGHGSASSCNFNHNTGKNILVDSLTQGYMFAGCNIFDDNGADPFSGMIQLAGCAGVVFSGCQIMANIQVDGLNRINQMVGCSFYGDREYLISSGDNSNGYLVFTNCTQGGGGFKANIPGVNATYGFISADYQSTANPSVVKFNAVGVHSGAPLLDKETGICVAQSTGLYCISFKITASAQFSVTLVANGSPHSKSIAGQIGSIYACSLTSYVYLQKGQQFNVSIECAIGTTIQQQSTILAFV